MDNGKYKTVNIRKDAHKKVAIYCAENEENIGDFFSDAAIEKLDKEVTKSKKSK